MEGRDNWDLILTGTSSPLADFLWITPQNPPETKKPRIGVILKRKDNLKEFAIEKVLPGSPAEKAGLLSEDQFVAAGGKEVAKIEETHQALERKGEGRNITFTILQTGLKKEIRVELPSLGQRVIPG